MILQMVLWRLPKLAVERANDANLNLSVDVFYLAVVVFFVVPFFSKLDERQSIFDFNFSSHTCYYNIVLWLKKYQSMGMVSAPGRFWLTLKR